MLNRRHFLATGAAVGASASALAVAATTAPSAAAAATGGRLDATNSTAVMNALVKLRGSLDGKLAFWWMKGPRYGVVGTQVTPLFENLVASWHRFVRQPDGNYKVTVVELSYYVDLKTGKFLEKWRNPITGAMNDVEYIVFGPVTATMKPNGITPPESTPGAELRVKPTIGVISQYQDDIWMQEDVAATIIPKTAGRTPYSGNDIATYHGSVKQILDPSRQSADASIHYQSITDWRTWMKMGDIKGALMARSTGRKVWTADDMPQDIIAIAKRMHPKIIGNPMAAMEAAQPDASFQR